MKNILTLLFVISCHLVHAQNFNTGHTTITFLDSSRNNRNIETEIYYPADSTGDNVPISTLTSQKFPVLVFGHGFVMTWSAYQYLWQALTAEGYIVAFPKTETSIAPQHIELGKDLALLIDAIKLQGQNNGSLFFNRVDSTSCVMGHSMGGGASFLAVQFNSSITAIANFAAAETNPSAIAIASSILIPSLIIAASNDCVTTPATNQIPMYDSLQSICKTFISITGGSHCQMADNNFLCSIGEATCTPIPTISRATQHSIIIKYLIPWLNFTLKSSCASGNVFDSTLIADSDITFQRNCILCNTTGVNSNSNIYKKYLISPIPFSKKISVKINTDKAAKFTVKLYSCEGKTIPITSQVFHYNELDIYMENAKNGIYFLEIKDENSLQIFKIIKLD